MRHTSFLVITFAVILSAGCTPKEEKAREERAIKVATGTLIQTINTAMPNGQQALPGHGKEVGMAYGAVSPVGAIPSNGVATAHYLEDGASIIGVQANIEVPADGYFYEAWLEKPDGSNRISLGHLTNSFNDVRHTTRFESIQDLRSSTKIRITRERDDGNPNPSETVAEATLKPTSR